MKTILVPVELNDLIGSTLQTAAALGGAFESYLEGFALSPALSPFLAADAMGATIIYDPEFKRDDGTSREAKRVFEEAMRAHEIPARTAATKAACYSWNETPQGDHFLASHGRLFDVTVVGRPGTKEGQPRIGTLEAALFDSGRPVLIAPPRPLSTLGQTAAIAWNGSTETARTISFAMPLLHRASRVVLLTVEGSGVPGPSGEEVAAYLGHRGIVCEAQSIKPGARSAGEAFLDRAAELDSDLLVKGAFTQSRLRQMIFGGATRKIIAEAELPVFMAH